MALHKMPLRLLREIGVQVDKSKKIEKKHVRRFGELPQMPYHRPCKKSPTRYSLMLLATIGWVCIGCGGVYHE